MSIFVLGDKIQCFRVTIRLAACVNSAVAVCFPSSPAIFAGMADIKNRLQARTLAHLVAFDSFADLHNHACALVASTLDPHFGHLWHGPVVEHKMDVTEAESSGIKFNQDIFGAYATDYQSKKSLQA